MTCALKFACKSGFVKRKAIEVQPAQKSVPADSGAQPSMSDSHCAWPAESRESHRFITQRKSNFS